MTTHAHRLSKSLILSLSTLTLLAVWSTTAWAQLASGPWPMFRHDTSHIALSPYHDATPVGTAWTRYTGDGLSSPVIGPDGTIYIGGNPSLYALNSDGTVKWSANINSATRSTPAVASDGTVYIGSLDNRLYAFTSGGAAKWNYATGNQLTSSPAIGPDGVVYIGSRDGYLYAINPVGTRKWRYSTGDIHMSSPVVGSDGTVYVGGGSSLWAIRSSDGTLKWRYILGSGTTSSPAISADGSTIYIGCYDGNLYAVSSTGVLVWQVQVGFKNASTCSSPAIAADGTIYIGSNYGSLHAIAPDGNEKWIFETKSDVRSSVAISADGTLYFGSWDGFIYALNSNGTEKWHYLTKSNTYASPAIAEDGTVVMASMDGYVIGNLRCTPSPSTPPSDLTATMPTDTQATLSWADHSSDEYGFRVERRMGTIGIYSVVANVGAGVAAYTDSGLQSGQIYYYRVCAYQSAGNSAYSNEAYVVTPGLETPAGLVATTVSASEIDLSWTDESSDELGFMIERRTGPNGLFEEIAEVGVNVQAYNDMSPYPATNYYYRVRAYDATRLSSYSNEAWALTPGKDFSEISRGDLTRKQMALTFDAGTAAIRTGLLSTLKSNSVYSNFFITGYVTEVQGPQVYQIAHDGHLVGNHSYDHPDLRYCTDDEIVRQLSATDDIIYNASGTHTRSLFRAPYGARNQHVLDVAAGAGFRHVAWTADSGDSAGATTQQIIDATMSHAGNGAIIVYHCTIANTEAAIPTIITQLRGLGYELVTVPEVVAPKQVVSPAGVVTAGWNLISLPLEPATPFPHIVFRGLSIDHALYRWNKPTAAEFQYDASSPQSFGNINPDEGYWLWLPASVPASGAVKCNGSAVPVDRHIRLGLQPGDRSAGSFIGYPFETPQEFSNCKVFNPSAPDPKTRPVQEAIQLGWISNALFGWDAATQSQFSVSVPEYYPERTQLEPWHGYTVVTTVPGVELIIPKP